MMSTSKGIIGAIAVAVLIGVALVAMYLGGWWLFADSTKREGEIRRDTFEFQQGQIDAARQKITEVNGITVQLTSASPEATQALTGQRRAIVVQVCNMTLNVNNLPTDLSAFRAKECV